MNKSIPHVTMEEIFSLFETMTGANVALYRPQGLPCIWIHPWSTCQLVTSMTGIIDHLEKNLDRSRQPHSFLHFQFRILHPILHKIFPFLFSRFTRCRIRTLAFSHFAFYTRPDYGNISVLHIRWWYLLNTE